MHRLDAMRYHFVSCLVVVLMHCSPTFTCRCYGRTGTLCNAMLRLFVPIFFFVLMHNLRCIFFLFIVTAVALVTIFRRIVNGGGDKVSLLFHNLPVHLPSFSCHCSGDKFSTKCRRWRRLAFCSKTKRDRRRVGGAFVLVTFLATLLSCFLGSRCSYDI
jgi:hypothetical protein